MGLQRVIEFAVDLSALSSFPIFIGYLIIVFLGQFWSKISRPLHLRWLLVLYNTACSIAALCCLSGFTYGISQSQSLFDMKPSEILKPFFMLYWITKIAELLDTVFMIFRHKGRQVTFLHVFHHSTMLILCEYAYLYAPWPAISVGMAINSFIHVVLYLYYGLTAYNPNLTKTWKRRITEMQIAQFLIDLVYASIGYCYHGFCIYCIFYGLAMLALFSNFYRRAYVCKRPMKQQ